MRGLCTILKLDSSWGGKLVGEWRLLWCTLDTTIVSICGEARGTKLAEGLVVLDNAGRVSGACRPLAGVLALVLDARLSAGAAPVLEADGSGRVAAGGADADSLVVQHLAFLPCRADCSIATWVSTASVGTGLVGGALVVDPALHLVVRAGQLSLLVDDEAEFAGSLSGAALGPNAVEGLGRGGLTGWVGATSYVRTADEALWALTARLVDDHLADSVVTTGCSQTAGVYTLAPDAG